MFDKKNCLPPYSMLKNLYDWCLLNISWCTLQFWCLVDIPCSCFIGGM